jgi:hypothetical protein
MMELTDLRDGLLTVTTKTYHYAPPENVRGNYIVWAEDGETATIWADNVKKAKGSAGTVDYFTKTEYDPNIAAIEALFNVLKIGWKLNSVQHERETGYIHYEWVWRMF